MSFFQSFANVDWGMINEGIVATLIMSVLSLVGAVLIGMPIGILLFLTKKEGLLANKWIHLILSVWVNFFRSVPFVILMLWMVDASRFVFGSALGIKGALIPLIVGAAPFFARLVENNLLSLKPGITEACRAMGANVRQTIFWALLPEARIGIIQSIVVTEVVLIGYVAICGIIGAGGLGDIAINFGYYRYDKAILWVSVILTVVIVQLIELIGYGMVKFLSHQ